jgi:hypothetical protein
MMCGTQTQNLDFFKKEKSKRLKRRANWVLNQQLITSSGLGYLEPGLISWTRIRTRTTAIYFMGESRMGTIVILFYFYFKKETGTVDSSI